MMISVFIMIMKKKKLREVSPLEIAPPATVCIAAKEETAKVLGIQECAFAKIVDRNAKEICGHSLPPALGSSGFSGLSRRALLRLLRLAEKGSFSIILYLTLAFTCPVKNPVPR